MSRRHAIALATTTALATTLVSGCEQGSDIDDDKVAYVALGDSYTAAPYTGETGDVDGCLRSEANYPHLLAESADLGLTDVSCSGATSDAIEDSDTSGRARLRPQLDAITSDTDLVTLRIGLNDFGLAVAVFGTCVEVASSDPTGAPCARQDTITGDSIDTALDKAGDEIADAVDAVVERAKDARVIIVGYPTIFPETGPCAQLPIAAGDVATVRNVVDTVNDALRHAAEDHGLTFLDVARATEGHDICASDPWVAGAAVEPGRGAAPWHPYVEEQQAVADLLHATID